MSSDSDAKPKQSGVPLKPRKNWPMQKGGTLSDKEKRRIAGETRAQKQDYKEQSGELVLPVPEPKQKVTTEDDYHTLEYNYGDKLPKNKGIPIPSGSGTEQKQRQDVKTTKPDKHAYKVNWT